jgi:hypothetical protein
LKVQPIYTFEMCKHHISTDKVKFECSFAPFGWAEEEVFKGNKQYNTIQNWM